MVNFNSCGGCGNNHRPLTVVAFDRHPKALRRLLAEGGLLHIEGAHGHLPASGLDLLIAERAFGC
jgi:hypothetical protein